MNERNNPIFILNDLMEEIEHLASERELLATDIVHEALREYLNVRTQPLNLFDVLHAIENNAVKVQHFAVATNLPAHRIIIKSPLQYAFRPTLKYEVELKKVNKVIVGVLRVILRSQDLHVLKSYYGFLNIWMDLEEKYLVGKNGYEKMEYGLDGNCFTRYIHLPVEAQQASNATVGGAICDYIGVLDELFKYYFYHPECDRKTIEKRYVTVLTEGKLII